MNEHESLSSSPLLTGQEARALKPYSVLLTWTEDEEANYWYGFLEAQTPQEAAGFAKHECIKDHTYEVDGEVLNYYDVTDLSVLLVVEGHHPSLY